MDDLIDHDGAVFERHHLTAVGDLMRGHSRSTVTAHSHGTVAAQSQHAPTFLTAVGGLMRGHVHEDEGNHHRVGDTHTHTQSEGG